MSNLQKQTNLIEAAVTLLQAMKEGKISLHADGVEKAELRIENGTADLNFHDEESLKALLKHGSSGQESGSNSVEHFKSFAEKLKQNGSTLTISHKGTVIITLGHKAKPLFSKMLTQSDSIELNSLATLISLMK